MTGDRSKADRANRFLLPALALAWLPLLWFCHRGAFDGPFYGDTAYHLQERTNLHLTALSWTGLWDAAHLDFHGPLYRPLSNWSLAFTHYYWGLRPAAYRIGNLLIHWSASLALLFLFREVLRSPRVTPGRSVLDKHCLPVALVGVALWSLHPIQTNVTTYVIQRMASLAGLFTFLCVGAYIRGRSSPYGGSWIWGTVALLSFGFAVASKESAATLIPLLFLCEFLLLVPPSFVGSRWPLGALALGAMTLGVFLAVFGPAFWALVGAGYNRLPFTMAQRLLTEARLQFQYLLVLLVPDPRLLTFDAEVEISTGFLDPPTTAGALVALAAAGVLAVRTGRTHPLLSFGILWFGCAQAVESTILPLELYFEHRMYVPAVFLYLGAGVLAAKAFSHRMRVIRVGTAVLLGALLCTEVWATVNRNTLWAHPVLFWADAVDKAPRKTRTHLNLGEALIRYGFYPEAEKELTIAGTLGGMAGHVAFNRGIVAYRRGHLGQAEMLFEEAASHTDIPTWFVLRRLADLALERGKIEKAWGAAAGGLGRKPDDAGLWEILGRVHKARGDLKRARSCLRRSLTYDPSVERVREELARLTEPLSPGEDASAPASSDRQRPSGRRDGP